MLSAQELLQTLHGLLVKGKCKLYVARFIKVPPSESDVVMRPCVLSNCLLSQIHSFLKQWSGFLIPVI